MEFPGRGLQNSPLRIKAYMAAKGFVMIARTGVRAVLSLALAAALSCISFAGQASAVDREAELAAFMEYVDEALPIVAQMTGIEANDPVPTVMLMRSEVRDYLIETLELEYPEGELTRRSECFCALGLVPEGYDLEGGIIEMLSEGAGAFYDPRVDDMKGIADLHPMLKSPQMQRMIVSHELTHALQDRVIDLYKLYTEALADLDRDYALRAVVEGMASNVMLPYMNGQDLGDGPDVQAYMRAGFDMKYGSGSGGAMGDAPMYVRESFLSPYAEGGGFVQAWISKYPDRTLRDLLLDMPPTSEQVMHFEKFEEGDEATPIDPARFDGVVPAGWETYYANTLGEFDLLMLFKSHPVTEAYADELAAGWDGCRWRAYHNDTGELVIVGLSVWDSAEDARDFASGFEHVLERIRDAGDFEIARGETTVAFTIGTGRPMASDLLGLSE